MDRHEIMRIKAVTCLVILFIPLSLQWHSLSVDANYIYIGEARFGMEEDVNITISRTEIEDRLLEHVHCYGEFFPVSKFVDIGSYEGPLPAHLYVSWDDFIYMKRINNTILVEYPKDAHNQTRGGGEIVFSAPFYGYVPLDGYQAVQIADVLCNISAIQLNDNEYEIKFTWLPSPFTYRFPLPLGAFNIRTWANGMEVEYVQIENPYEIMEDFDLIQVNTSFDPMNKEPIETLIEYELFLEPESHQYILTYASATGEINNVEWKKIYLHIHFPKNSRILSAHPEGYSGWNGTDWWDVERPVLGIHSYNGPILGSNVDITFQLKPEKNDESSVIMLDFPSFGILFGLSLVTLFLTGTRVRKHYRQLK